MKLGFKSLYFRAILKLIFIVVLIVSIFAGLSFTSCASTEGSKSSVNGSSTGSGPVIREGVVNAITVQQAYEIFTERNSDYFFLDVRTPEEFAEGHIENATLIPLDELEGRTGELPSDKAIIVYCRTGNRSLQASNILINKDFKKILNMEGGITEWKNNGYPVVTD